MYSIGGIMFKAGALQRGYTIFRLLLGSLPFWPFSVSYATSSVFCVILPYRLKLYFLPDTLCRRFFCLWCMMQLLFIGSHTKSYFFLFLLLFTLHFLLFFATFFPLTLSLFFFNFFSGSLLFVSFFSCFFSVFFLLLRYSFPHLRFSPGSKWLRLSWVHPRIFSLWYLMFSSLSFLFLLDALWRVNKSVGPSVRRSVGPTFRRSVGPSFRRSVRYILVLWANFSANSKQSWTNEHQKNETKPIRSKVRKQTATTHPIFALCLTCSSATDFFFAWTPYPD